MEFIEHAFSEYKRDFQERRHLMIYVANPLYDAVFKYLMEDERAAKTILSALLKKKVLEVEMRRHEYSNINRSDVVSMYRVDFAATVVDEDEKPHLMLVELQKTWLPTETLRFRRYLALQYNNEENMLPADKQKYAIPMVAVYLLGHCVGHVNESIFYVSHQAYDYDGNVIKEGMPDSFVESLQHDSIFVQIPLLHNRVNNRLEKVLSFFDQTNTADNKKVIRMDESQIAGDADMEHIVRRLQSAAADPDMRNQMNVEDEFFKELESRDTEIMEKDATIREMNATMKEQEATMKEQEAILKSTIQGLLDNGMSLESVAKILGKTESGVKAILEK